MSQFKKDSWADKIPEKIRGLRHESRLTQKELSELIDVSEYALRTYETGSRHPKIKTVRLIANVFDVDFEYLIAPSYISPLEMFYSIVDEGDNAMFDMSISDEAIVLTPRDDHAFALLNETREVMRDTGYEACDTKEPRDEIKQFPKHYWVSLNPNLSSHQSHSQLSKDNK